MADPTPDWQIQDAAIRARLSGATMGVLLALLNFRQAGHFETWPSLASIAKRTGYCTRQVRRALRALEAGGWLTRVYDPEHQATPHYTPLVPAMSGGGGHVDVRGGRTSWCPPDDPEDDPLETTTDPLSPEKGTSVDTRATPRRESESSPNQERPMPEDPKPTPLPPKLYHFDPEPSARTNLTTVVPLSADRPSVPPHRVKRPLLGDEVDLPGDLLECLADLGPQAIPMYRRCEALGITTTAALLAIPEARLRYQRGFGEHRAQVLRNYFAEMGILFAEEQDSKQIVASLTKHAQAVKERAEAPRGLRLIRGGGA